jgi:hypothetical protein
VVVVATHSFDATALLFSRYLQVSEFGHSEAYQSQIERPFRLQKLFPSLNKCIEPTQHTPSMEI